MKLNSLIGLFSLCTLCLYSCSSSQGDQNSSDETRTSDETVAFLDQPLVTDLYTADPSAHVFDGKIYIYPSHDIASSAKNDDSGDQYDMKDYHVFSMDGSGSEVVDHGKVLDVEKVKWAKKQMWAPDAAEKDGKYYLYFPAKDKEEIFRLGVAVSDNRSV